MESSTLKEWIRKYYKDELLIEKLGMSRATINRKLNEPENFTIKEIFILAKILETDVPKLIERIKIESKL